MKKLDPRTTSGYFIGYAVNSKGFRFYCPSHSPRIVESINAKFLEDSEPSGSAYPQRIEFEEAQELTEAPLPQRHLIVLKKNQLITLNHNQLQNSQLMRNKFILNLLRLCQMRRK
jgi:hypothetical protein